MKWLKSPVSVSLKQSCRIQREARRKKERRRRGNQINQSSVTFLQKVLSLIHKYLGLGENVWPNSPTATPEHVLLNNEWKHSFMGYAKTSLTNNITFPCILFNANTPRFVVYQDIFWGRDVKEVVFSQFDTQFNVVRVKSAFVSLVLRIQHIYAQILSRLLQKPLLLMCVLLLIRKIVFVLNWDFKTQVSGL